MSKPAHRPHSKHTYETTQRVCELAEGGMAAVDISRTIGLPVRTVRDMLERHGIEVSGQAFVSDRVAQTVNEWAPVAVAKGFQMAMVAAEKVEKCVNASEAKQYADAYKALMDGAYTAASKFMSGGQAGVPLAPTEYEDEWEVDSGIDSDDAAATDFALDDEDEEQPEDVDDTMAQVLRTHQERVEFSRGPEEGIHRIQQIAGPPPVITPGDSHRTQVGHSLPHSPEVKRAHSAATAN